MSQVTAQQLSVHLRDHVGRGLRTVVVVQEDDMEIQYLRSDLKNKYSEDVFADIVDTFHLEQPFMSPGADSTAIGERRAVIHYHQNAILLLFPVSETESILVSISYDIGSRLLQFIENCRYIIDYTE